MSLKNLKTRINYRGGAQQVDRVIEDKERSFKESLWRAYQSATAVLKDDREFRCLINPNKLNMELDDKMLSIPFKDVCLNTNEQENIGVKCGDVIAWKENGTHWIIYSQYLQEVAYFRGLMRQCESEPLDINGNKYYYYLKGPDEKGIDWQKTKHFVFNDLNYNIEIYISNDEITNQFFQRHKKCYIKGNPYKVAAVDRLSTDGILTVYLKEDYRDELEENVNTVANKKPTTANIAYIDGIAQVYPYDIVEYHIVNAKGGKWNLSNNRARILNQSDEAVKIEITTGKSGNISLIYKRESKDDVVYNIQILSL